MRSRRPVELFTTSVTLAEVYDGIRRLPDGRRRDGLRTAAEEVISAFRAQNLSFDEAAAGDLATRNVKGFEGTGVEVVDPWRT